jgi:predicted exporter
LRRPRRIAAVLAPLAAAVICTAAVLLVTGGTLSIFNLFGLLLVVAVGSNYCLFFERGEASFGVHRHGAPFPRHGASFPRHDASFPRHDASFPRHGPPPTWSGEARDGGQSAGNDRVLNQTATTARQRMVASLVLANLCTVIGFGILSFSRFPVLHGIGVTVAIGAFLCLLFGAIVNAPHPRAATGN